MATLYGIVLACLEKKMRRAEVSALVPRFEEMRSLYRWDWSGHADGENRTRFFDTSVRMNHKRRSLDVRRQNIREMLSEMSGSWEISLFLGWLIIVVKILIIIIAVIVVASSSTSKCKPKPENDKKIMRKPENDPKTLRK